MADSRTKIQLIEDAEATGDVAAVYDEWRCKSGRQQMPGILKCFSHRPDFLREVMKFSDTVHFSEGHLTRRTKEAIASWVSYLNRCPYWLDSHAYFLRVQGANEKTVQALAHGKLDEAELSQAERVLLDYVSKVTEAAYRTTAEDVQLLREHGWTDPQIGEAVYITAMFAFFNRVADAFGIPPQRYLELDALTKWSWILLDMKAITRRWSLRFAGILVVLWLGFVGFVYWAMNQPPEVFGRVMMHMPIPAYFLFPFETMWTQARFGHVNPGDFAPDYTVEKLETNEPVQLSSLWMSRPVVLVFGSYTWPPFRREVPALNKLAEQYKDTIAFYAVYILEAHPTDVWQMQSNVRDHVIFASPKNETERFNVAGACVRKLGIKFPALVDGFDNRVETAYTAWPDRLYLIAAGGRVLYKSKPGPFGFDPGLLADAIKSASR